MREKTGIERLQKMKQLTKPKKIDKIVRGILIYWVVFVLLCFITFWVKDSVPDTLIQYGLGGGALELVVTALIEISRDKYNKEKNNE